MLPAHLATNIRDQILYYLESTFEYRDRTVNMAFRRFLEDPETGLFRGPWIDLRRPFRPASADEVVPFAFEVGFRPFKHQNRAWRRLSSKERDPQPTIVTTGTGSGKTECFLFPILDHCLRARRAGQRGIKSIILYPMNALASDQERRFAKVIHDSPALRDSGLTVGNYTGRYDPASPGAGDASGTSAMGKDHGITNHRTQMEAPPDILLTNYKMLDYLLLRPQDQPLWRFNEPGILKYLVLDELHTYDGAQGSDVACLIRRLKERLGVSTGSLCVVGTSATLDDRGSAADRAQGARGPAVQEGKVDAAEKSADRLARFASTLFEEEITYEAVISEDRLEVAEIVSPERTDTELPDASRVRPRSDDVTETYVIRQARLFGCPIDDTGMIEDEAALALGSWLKGSELFAQVLMVFESAHARREIPLDMPTLVERLTLQHLGLGKIPSFDDRAAIVSSFLAIVSQAREKRSGFAFPLVPMVVQLWIRELRRVGRLVDPNAVFTWLDEPIHELKSLPAFHCGECGESGWIGLGDPASETDIGTAGVTGIRIKTDPTAVYRGWFMREKERDINLVVLSPDPRASMTCRADLGEEDQTDYFLCPESLVLRQKDGPCPLTGDSRRFPVKVNRVTRKTEKGRTVGDQGCSNCGSKEGVFFVGAQSATLSSVALDELFGSALNRDPKLLAFTDSVQDASHRAGFFTARTYRFTFRTALQHLIDRVGAEGLSAEQVGFELLRHWENSHGPWKGTLRRALGALLPPDLQEDSAYLEFRNDPAVRTPPGQLLVELHQRLAWEAIAEFGFMQTHGRTLERVGCAALGFDMDRVRGLAQALSERLPGIDPTLVGIEPALLERWIHGILHRHRVRGALDHPYVRDLARTGLWGKTDWRGRFVKGRERHPVAIQYKPHLMVTGASRAHDHVLASSRGTQLPWHIVWARRVLRSPELPETSILDLVREFLERGVEHGITVVLEKTNKRDFYGIDITGARIYAGGLLYRCSQTDSDLVRPEHEVALWEGAPSMVYEAINGTYQRAEYRARQLYYQDRYRKGALRRVVASEHTGLLRTSDRERLENQFAHRVHEDDPNVLTCTSTLEMGIDIGDLSSTMLCSIPPSTASYLQRIGRAGRATGAALIISVVNQRPHDLFFFGRPFEMLRGRVDPPGCWLDASAVLVRQYLAFCFDCASHERRLKELPRTGKQLVDDLARTDGHIPSFFRWVTENESSLQNRFLRRYRVNVRDDTRERFMRETTAENLREHVYVATNDFDRMVRDLENARSRLRDQKQKTESGDRETQAEIDRELRILKGRLVGLGRTSALEILTDNGLLPNYAFPERGVRFFGSVYSALGSQQVDPPPIEVVRPAGAAIRELAPFNHFYTHRRKFTIQQISIGNPQQSLAQDWAICGACGHMRRVEDLRRPEAQSACPQCGHDRDHRAQCDHGQHRSFLEFSQSQALSHMEYFESLSADRSDERSREYYQIARSFDVTHDRPMGAVGDDALPFGIEYREAVTMREINTGYPGSEHKLPFGVGQEVSEEGFRVCRDCGVAAPDKLVETRVEHRRSCRADRQMRKLEEEGRKGDPYTWSNLYLYRQIRSEAIRLLLPVADDEDLDTLTACIHLGLRLRFEGDPTHLIVQPQIVPDTATGMERYFLVILDGVPGGTGYLKTLYQQRDDEDREGQGIVEVLRLARDILETCVCRNFRQDPKRPDSDGCYRCIRTYHLQYRAENISRERGITVLDQLLEGAARRVAKEELAQIRPNSPFDSMLERRFVKAIQSHVRDTGGTWTETMIRGNRGFRFQLKGQARVWELELQPRVGAHQGVDVQSRPDFLLTSDDEGIRPIAVFTDGFEFHVHPNNRLADDVRKRRALLESGAYWVWSVTWDDLQGDAPLDLHASDAHRSMMMQTAQALRKSRSVPSVEKIMSDSLAQLLAFLQCPERTAWKELLVLSMTAPLLARRGSVSAGASAVRGFLEAWSLGDEGARLDTHPEGELLVESRVSAMPDIVATLSAGDALQMNRTPPTIRIRIPDREQDVVSPGIKERWRRLLACMNLYQFLDTVVVFTLTEAAEGLVPGWDPDPNSGDREAWEPVRRGVVSSLVPIVDDLCRAGVPLPEVEYAEESVDEAAFAEMAWKGLSPRIAVLAGEQEHLASRWQQQGWKVITLSDLAASGSRLLVDMVRRGQEGP